MADRPILFSAPMVRALLEGGKTQTRRALKPQPSWEPATVDGCSFAAGWSWAGLSRFPDAARFCEAAAQFVPCAPGDRLWVKEAHSFGTKAYPDCLYRADDGGYDLRWRSPIHMPRWASRLTLLVTDVRVQRLQDISEADALAEGVEHHAGSDGPCAEFEALWNSINGPDAWAENPWVAAITFEVVHANIDQVQR